MGTVGAVERPDGRRVGWALHGPPDGRLVLFVAGAATGRSMTFGEDLLVDAGVRLLTVDRPGIGVSDPSVGRTLASTADDLAAVVSTHTVPPVPMVANSQGAPFGIALAATGAASCLVLVSPADEVAHDEVRRRLGDAERAVVDQVLADPEAARAFLAGLDAEAMERLVVDGADPADAAVYTEPAFARRYRRALGEGFAHDGEGYATDTVLAMSPWDLDLAAIPCPVTVLFGARDRTHSPDHGELLASRFGGARRQVVDDAGGALLWTHAGLVLEAVTSLDEG